MKAWKENSIRSVQKLELSEIAWSEQREWTRLGRIYNMEIKYQVSSMSEFGYGDPLRFVFGIFIP